MFSNKSFCTLVNDNRFFLLSYHLGCHQNGSLFPTFTMVYKVWFLSPFIIWWFLSIFMSVYIASFLFLWYFPYLIFETGSLVFLLFPTLLVTSTAPEQLTFFFSDWNPNWFVTVHCYIYFLFWCRYQFQFSCWLFFFHFPLSVVFAILFSLILLFNNCWPVFLLLPVFLVALAVPEWLNPFPMVIEISTLIVQVTAVC